jgi:hypothetical protein
MNPESRLSRPASWQSLLVLATLAPVLLDGCVSVDVSRAKTASAESSTGSLEVVVVEKSGDKTPTTSKIVTRLVRLESGVEIPVSESTDATWTKTDLAPGRYRLRVSHWIDEKGEARKFAKTDQESFKVRAGEFVQARVVLKAFPTGPVITVAAVAGGAILLAALISALNSWGSGTLNLGSVKRSERLDRDRTEREQPRSPVPAFR